MLFHFGDIGAVDNISGVGGACGFYSRARIISHLNG